MEAGLRNFKKISLTTLIVLFLLIGVGGLIYVTESSMGCPDWPKCFGFWLPPTCDCKLPANYHELYKNNGYPSGVNFDSIKTMLVFLNRILGLMALLLLIVTLYEAHKIRLTNRIIFRSIAFCLIFALLEIAIAAYAIRNNIMQESFAIRYTIGVAMICVLAYAIAIVFNVNQNEKMNQVSKRDIFPLLLMVFATVNLLVVLSNQTRLVNGVLTISQNASFVVLNVILLSFMLFFTFRIWLKAPLILAFQIPLLVLFIVIVILIINGFLLWYLKSPQLLVVLHITLAAVLFCSQFYIYSFIKLKKGNI